MILAWLLSPLGRVAAAAVAAFMAFKAVQYSGVTKERARVEKVETKKNDAARKAVDTARKSVAADPKRVLERHYRD